MLSALIIGLMGSLHCAGMCGPLVVAMPFHGNGNATPRVMAYHSGRLLAYGLIGAAIGLIGGGLRIFFLQQWISIASGVLLLLIYFLPKLLGSERFPNLSSAWNRHVVIRMKKLLQPNADSPLLTRMFSIGFLNGFLPCGLVYMALVGAVSMPTVLGSALFMVVFGLGTSPMLTGIIAANKMVLGKVRTSFGKAIPFFVVLVSTLLILRGLGLGIPYVSPANENSCCHKPEALIDKAVIPEVPSIRDREGPMTFSTMWFWNDVRVP